MSDNGKSLADYAKMMGVKEDELKDALKKYGMQESGLINNDKRLVLANAIENKWSVTEFKAQYRNAMQNNPADWSWDRLLKEMGYNGGVLKEFEKDLKPLFRWLADQLAKGETLDNLKPEFFDRLADTKFGNRTPEAIQADIDRYGKGTKKAFQEKVSDLTKRIRSLAINKYGTSIKDSLDGGVARKLALDLIYAGDLNDDDIFLALKPIFRQDYNDATKNPGDNGAPPVEGGDAGTAYNNLMTWLSRNGVELGDGRIRGYLSNIVDDGWTLDQVKQDIRRTVFTNRYMGYADQFEKGLDITDVAIDYQERMASLLERNLGDIKIDDDLIRRALENKGTDGKYAPLALYEFEQMVRETPEWDKTNNAMKAYTNLGETILKNFGFRG